MTAEAIPAPAAETHFLHVSAPGAVQVLKAGDPDAAKREVSGLALPYNEDLDRPDFLTGARRQRFAPGCAVVRTNASLYYGHDHLSQGLPIGRVTDHADTDPGLELAARISQTAKGEEVYTLARDGVLDRFSVGYRQVRNHLEEDGDVLVHDEIDVFEVSLVPDPAFQSATVNSVLAATRTATRPAHPAKETQMTTTAPEVDLSTLASSEDVSTLSTAVEDLTRKVATLGAGLEVSDRAPHVPGKSYGEFLKMAARGEKEVTDFLAFVGSTTDDLGTVLKDSWVGDRFRRIEAQRTTLNLFTRRPLPADGMGIEYGVVGTDTTAVAEQVNEGDTLAYGKVTFDTDRAPLKTFGGWGDMSRQLIERSPINVVETFFDALVNRYAATTEAQVAALLAASGVTLGGTVTNMSTAAGWRSFVIRAARQLKALGYPIEGVAVSFDVFEALANMTEASANKPFLDQDSGAISIPGLSGQVFNLKVTPIETGATTNVIQAYNSQAISTYEEGRAPVRLNDSDITNLTEAFSVYGYMVTALEIPGAIVKPKIA